MLKRLILGGALALAVASPAVAAPPPVTLSPAPGTPAASPDTQISILGVAPSRIASVTVRGAVSGAHTGRLRAYAAERGASFLLDQPLTQGERASATVRVRGLRRTVRTTFTVAHLAPPQPYLNITKVKAEALQEFVTEPGLQAPKIEVLRPLTGAPGSILLTPLPSPVIHPESDNAVTIDPVGPGGPMIVDGQGRLVWFRRLTSPDVAANLTATRFRGKPVLTWWQGPVTPSAYGQGEGVIADTRYRTVATVHAGNGYKMDIHEFRLTNHGTAVFTVYSPILVHLPGTPAEATSPLLDSIVQEVDIHTGLVVWEWHAYGHIPLAQSYATPENSSSYDAFHINSIQPLRGGRVLISARDTATIYLLDRATGRIRWRLGGKASDFRMGPGARFWLQHDARLLPGGRVSLFDDEAGPPQKAPASRGLILKLDHHRRRATVSAEYRRSPTTSAQSEGSTQLLPGGDVFVGFGSTPYFSQFSAGGRLLFDAKLPDGDGSYRVERHVWNATPATLPLAAARAADAGHVTVYASWNGATAVARWQVLDGAGVVGSAARDGFETAITVPAGAGPYAVRALDARGRTLATSPAVAVTAQP
jgi:hypothetical protein